MADVAITRAHDVMGSAWQRGAVPGRPVTTWGANVPGGGVTTVYRMRAWHTVLLTRVYWEAEDAPDLTGASSGYSPQDLDVIAVVDVFVR